MSILYRFRVIARFSSKVTNFNPPDLHLIPFEFRHDIWHQKTRVMGLSCGVVCVILCLAVLIQYRSVTDTHTHTDRQTRRRHIPRLARRRAVKTGQMDGETRDRRTDGCQYRFMPEPLHNYRHIPAFSSPVFFV